MLRFLVMTTLSLALTSVQAATFTVTNLNDSGSGSLRDAITQANAGTPPNTINFDPSVTGTITLTTGQIQISGALTIVGPGASSLTINANANSRVFSVYATDPACPAIDGPDYLVSISGLRLTNARRKTSNGGGAIFTEHSLALDSVVIDNSVAGVGSGVFDFLQYAGQSLTIDNTQFLNNINKPVIASPTADDDGALYLSERCSGTRTTPVNVNIANSLFSGNLSQPVLLSTRGAAITTFSYADIVITDTAIVGNQIDVPNPPVANEVYRGAGMYGTAKSLKLERTEISDNTVIDVTSSDQTRGGGVGLFNNASDLQAPASAMAVTIINSTISGNSVPANGGAVWVFGNIALALDNSTVANNSAAAGQSGGIQITTGSTNPVTSSNATPPTLTVVSSILGDSAAGSVDVETNTALIPSFTIDSTNSLIETICSTCSISISGTGNLTATDPLLQPLGFNGGPTRTQALSEASPAINAGSNPLSLATDQRGSGFPRVVGLAADMGAYESPSFCGTKTYPFPYADVTTVTDPFCPGIMEAYVTGISKGTTPTTFSPNNDVTRVQMTTFLQRSLDQGLARASRRAAVNQSWTAQKTNAMQTISTGGGAEFCAADGGAIWTSTHSTVVEVQANTGAILGTWTGAVNSFGVLAAAGKVFVAGDTVPGNLYVIDPTQPPGAVTVATGLGNQPISIAFDGTNLWTANIGPPGSVSMITPTPPYTVTTVTTGFNQPIGILYDGSHIWVTDSGAGTLLKLDASGNILQTVTVGAGQNFPVFDGANIWVPNNFSNSITVVQASTGNVVATISTDAANMLSGPSMASFDGERILVTNTTGNSVTVFKAVDLSFVANVPIALSNPYGACSDGINFWVDLHSTGKLLRF